MRYATVRWWKDEGGSRLRAASAGELVFDQADPKLRPELLRSAVKGAIEILDRALGTTKQMHEHKVQGGISWRWPALPRSLRSSRTGTGPACYRHQTRHDGP